MLPSLRRDLLGPFLYSSGPVYFLEVGDAHGMHTPACARVSMEAGRAEVRMSSYMMLGSIPLRHPTESGARLVASRQQGSSCGPPTVLSLQVSMLSFLQSALLI